MGTRAVLDEVGGLLDGSMVETVEDFMITPLVYRLKNSMSCQERQPRKMTCDERWVREFVEGKKKKGTVRWWTFSGTRSGQHTDLSLVPTTDHYAQLC